MTETRAASWEGLEASRLARRWGAAAVHLYDRVGSTNDVARRLAGDGSPLPAVVLAEEQVAGRGRVGRAWASPRGLGLWFSVVAPPGAIAASGLLPLRVGLAVATALEPFVADVGVKWPNDLCVGAGKLGGILCEAVWKGSVQGALVAGVGLNLLQPAEAFPSEIRDRATSVRIASGTIPRRLDVADAVVRAVLEVAIAPGNLDVESLAARDLLHGERVRVADPMTGQTTLVGVAAGIDPDGALRVQTDDGVEAVRSGTVRILSAPQGP